MFFKNRIRDKAGQAPPGVLLRQEAERLLEKGRFKDAVKQSKLCYREAATPENHRLLERAYFLRAQQLHRNKMSSSAVEVAGHLLGFGVTDPDLTAELIPLLLALGMSRQALALGDRLESPEARAGITIAAADQAVIHPDRAPASLPELREGALQVRSALEALEAGDEAKALELLRAVARGSPFGDWKLFVRGLAAFYRQDAEQVAANWDRLDPGRLAVRIARRLRGLAEGAKAGAGAGADLATLEQRVFGEPILDRLRLLREHVAGDRWAEAIRLLGPLRDALRRYDPALAERLTRALIPALVESSTQQSYASAKALMRDFTRKAEPLALDPKWNRLWALIWEGPQGSPDEAEKYWRAYLKDLKALPALPLEQRSLAQALVWKHLGEQHLEEASAEAELLGPFGEIPDHRRVQRARQQAVECLEESLRLAPGHLPTHEELLKAYRDWGQPEQVEATARRLLEAFPDHLDTLVLLASHHFRRDEPERALEYAQRARALKPLDEGMIGLEWSTHVALARHHALKKRWDEGRAAFATAERLRPDSARDFHLLARRATFERKARQTDRAEELIREAQSRLVESTPLWLALQIESVRYRLPKVEKDRFVALWKEAIQKKCRSETAGAIAELLLAYLELGVEYTGRAGQIKDAVAYIRRTTRIKYRLEDLAHVCAFLVQLPREQALFEKMARRGVKNFPESPLFRMMVATHELSKGPFLSDLGATRTQFEKALELAEASTDPRDTALVPKIKEGLSMLSAITSGPLGMGLPFFGGGPGGPAPGGSPSMSPLEDLFNMFGGLDFDDEDDWLEDDFDDPEFLPVPPPSRSRSPASKGKTRKNKSKKKRKR